jgi:hypothetical protein
MMRPILRANLRSGLGAQPVRERSARTQIAVARSVDGGRNGPARASARVTDSDARSKLELERHPEISRLDRILAQHGRAGLQRGRDPGRVRRKWSRAAPVRLVGPVSGRARRRLPSVVGAWPLVGAGIIPPRPPPPDVFCCRGTADDTARGCVQREWYGGHCYGSARVLSEGCGQQWGSGCAVTALREDCRRVTVGGGLWEGSGRH